MIRVFVQACKALTSGKDMKDPALGPIRPGLPKTCCPRCKSSFMIRKNGSYRRHYVSIVEGAVVSTVIRIALVHCKSCSSSHALLPLTVIPRSPFSLIFIAHLITDKLDGRFASIALLCEHYGIAVNTYYRIYERFASCVKIACGIMAGTTSMRDVARILLLPCNEAAGELLCSFFENTNTSFCQPRAP